LYLETISETYFDDSGSCTATSADDDDENVYGYQTGICMNIYQSSSSTSPSTATAALRRTGRANSGRSRHRLLRDTMNYEKNKEMDHHHVVRSKQIMTPTRHHGGAPEAIKATTTHTARPTSRLSAAHIPYYHITTIAHDNTDSPGDDFYSDDFYQYHNPYYYYSYTNPYDKYYYINMDDDNSLGDDDGDFDDDFNYQYFYNFDDDINNYFYENDDAVFVATYMLLSCFTPATNYPTSFPSNAPASTVVFSASQVIYRFILSLTNSEIFNFSVCENCIIPSSYLVSRMIIIHRTLLMKRLCLNEFTNV
jgi:hypothetical protein